MAPGGKLEKSEIIALKDAASTDAVPDGRCVTKMNPETVTLTYEIKVSEDQAQATSGAGAPCRKIKGQELSAARSGLPDAASASSPSGREAALSSRCITVDFTLPIQGHPRPDSRFLQRADIRRGLQTP